jgi:iron only hydrogenase large subunit-like protein
LTPTFAADLTILEEANEFVERVKNGGTLPLITSCSPAGSILRALLPEFYPQPFTCKSPQQMFGALAKTWYAKQKGWIPGYLCGGHHALHRQEV